MMRFGIRSVLISFLILTLSGLAFAQSGWIGRYEFTEDGGKTAGGTGIVIVHEIQIMTSDKGLVATIKSNGYQTSVDLLALVKISGSKAQLFFEGYGDDNVFENYTKGQLLLSLDEKKEGNKALIITEWANFKPSVDKNLKSGRVYFTRTDVESKPN